MIIVIIDPYLPPQNGVGDTPPLPYYLYCLVGIGILTCGVLYWAAWQIVLPKVFGYELIPRKEKLNDGTVVTVVSTPLPITKMYRKNSKVNLFYSLIPRNSIKTLTDGPFLPHFHLLTISFPPSSLFLLLTLLSISYSLPTTDSALAWPMLKRGTHIEYGQQAFSAPFLYYFKE